MTTNLTDLEGCLNSYSAALTDLADAEQDLIREKRDAYLRSSGTSIAARDREVDLAVADLEEVVARARAEVQIARATWITALAFRGFSIPASD